MSIEEYLIEKMNNYEEHKHAKLFPLMTDGELSELVEDIERNGQLNPIVLLDGKILDGRNRQKACNILGIKVRYTTYNKKKIKPRDYVIAENLVRRHLNMAQKCELALKLLPEEKINAQIRREIGQKNGRISQNGKGSKKTIPKNKKGKALETIAKKTDTSASTLYKWQCITEKALEDNKISELKQKALNGDISVNRAYTSVEKKEKELNSPKNKLSGVEKEYEKHIGNLERALKNIRQAYKIVDTTMNIMSPQIKKITNLLKRIRVEFDNHQFAKLGEFKKTKKGSEK